MAPIDVHVLIPRTYAHVTIHDGGILQMWLRMLTWGGFPGLARWAQCHNKRPSRREAGGSGSRGPYSIGFEDGVRAAGQGMWEASTCPEKAWKQERDSPLELPGGTQP